MALSITELPLRDGHVGLCPLPGRGGDYAADLAVIAGWAPSLVLTMTTAEEMARHGAAGLGDDLGARGIGWAHLPVADFTAPDEEIAAHWLLIADRAGEILDSGGRVLAHCMGGCGRSGAAVLRLMTEAGEDPEAALARLRQVRPCAVERPEQFVWAAAGARA